MPAIRTIAMALCATSSLLFNATTFAQAVYPDRSVKVIVALPAGGSVDMIARTLGQKLNASKSQAFVVDNRAGASGQIGMPIVSKAPAVNNVLAGVVDAMFEVMPEAIPHIRSGKFTTLCVMSPQRSSGRHGLRPES